MIVDFKNIGKRIARRRNVLDITQAELAERADLSVTFTGNVERGTTFSIETLMKLSNALDVTPDYLLLGSDKNYRLDTEQDIKDLMYRCDAKKTALIKEFIKWFADQEI